MEQRSRTTSNYGERSEGRTAERSHTKVTEVHKGNDMFRSTTGLISVALRCALCVRIPNIVGEILLGLSLRDANRNSIRPLRCLTDSNILLNVAKTFARPTSIFFPGARVGRGLSVKIGHRRGINFLVPSKAVINCIQLVVRRDAFIESGRTLGRDERRSATKDDHRRQQTDEIS